MCIRDSTTPVVKKDFARVNLKTRLDIPSGKAFTDYRIVTELKAPDGKDVYKRQIYCFLMT